MTFENKEPVGIGGWLFLPMLGLIVTPFRLGNLILTRFIPIFQEGYWDILTTPGNEAYHQLWAPLLIFEIVGNLIFILFSIALLVLLFSKHHKFPSLMIAFLLSNLAFVFVDYFAGDLIPAVDNQSDPESLGEMVRVIVGAAIWVPYFRKSERVKNTFAVKSSTSRSIQLQPALRADFRV